MLVPAKKKKGNRRRHDRVESTLTVGAEETDPYAIKPNDPHTADDPAIPSYGKMMEDDNDEFDIFLRNAERADQREKERELARKGQNESQKPKKTVPQKGAVPAEKGAAKSGAPAQTNRPVRERPAAKERTPLRDGDKADRAALAEVDNLRAGVDGLRKIGLAQMKKYGLTEETEKTFLSCLSLMGNLLDVIGRLVNFPQEADARDDREGDGAARDKGHE